MSREVIARLGIDEIFVVDAHAHSFDPIREQGGFARQFSISEVQPAVGMVEHTVLFGAVLRELASLLGCKPTLEDVARRRATAYQTDPAAYVRQLVVDAKIATIIVDTGYPSIRASGYDVDMRAFAQLFPCDVQFVHRAESTLDDLLGLDLPLNEVQTRYRRDLDHAVRVGAVGFKSSIAYRTGLDIGLVDFKSAAAAQNRLRSHRGREGDRKSVRDWAFAETLRAAIQHDVPLQVHAGMGDGPNFDMRTARPSLLARVAADRELGRAKLVLTHAGYPWVEEAGWMANQFDNVYVDISEMNPFAAHGVAAKLLGLLELAPTHKVMYGSDGVHAPEVAWFGAKLGRRSVGLAISQLVEERWLTEKEGRSVARGILQENARALYQLGPSRHVGVPSAPREGLLPGGIV